jgi:glutamate dehydrogenase/leucine dehydrogenase
LFGQYKRLTNEFTGVLTGKGPEFGGSALRPEATGYGLCYFTEEMLKFRGDTMKGKKVLISGSGNVAQYAIEKVIELGGIPITASDSGGFIHDPDGIDEEKLKFILELKNVKRGRIMEYAKKYNVFYYEGQKPWGVKADIALPCATQNEVTEEDAKKLVDNGCKLVAEGANMPSTPEAISVFQKSGILYAPGKAANAGGVAVSGLEMSQNAQHLYWTREEVDQKLQGIMKGIHQKCLDFGKMDNGEIDYVQGANIGGFVRVADAMIAEGHV